MKQTDIEKDGVINTSAKLAPEYTDSISEEEFRELATLRAQQLNLKDKGYNLYEYLESIKAQTAEAERQLKEVQDNLVEVTNRLNTRFNEVLEPLGLSGNVTIDDKPDENGRYKATVVA